MGEDNLEKLMKFILDIDRLFNRLNNFDLEEMNNLEMAESCYLSGEIAGGLKKLTGYRGNPDYEKALVRLEIIKNKFYKEAQKRDEEEGR